MKKLVTILILSVVAIVLLILAAFFYIDLSGHKNMEYDVFFTENPCGTVKVDRYATESKVIYKSQASYTKSLEYSFASEELFLNKGTMTLSKYTEEAKGAKGQKRLTIITHEGEKSDFLFVDHPRFMDLEGFETGKNTLVFYPEDIMLYMPIVEKYNYWKKGTQFFEIMVPVGEPLPPMRDQLGVKYAGEEYLTVMGNRVEVECLEIFSRSLPEAKIYVSKYAHTPLELVIEGRKMRFTLRDMSEGVSKRIVSTINKAKTFLKKDAAVSEEKEIKVKGSEKPASDNKNIEAGKEIFFESGNLILSGRMWVPERKGPYPAVILVHDDGPITAGEQALFNSLGEFLSLRGFIVFDFDYPGQRKSHGSLSGLNDDAKERTIINAASYLKGEPLVKKDSINMLGYGGGGYMALKASSTSSFIKTVVVVGAPRPPVELELSTDGVKKNIYKALTARGIGPFEDGFVTMVADKTKKHVGGELASNEEFSFFKGVKLPSKEYRDFMGRNPYKTMLSFDRPLLLVAGSDDRYFDADAVKELENALKKVEKNDKVAVFRNLGEYMGAMTKKDGGWTFKLNSDAADILYKWLEANGVAVQPKEEAPKE